MRTEFDLGENLKGTIGMFLFPRLAITSCSCQI